MLNPADPPLIMRDTIFCQLPRDADEVLITKAVEDAVANVAQYVPGYRLKSAPQFGESRDGTPRVAVLVEVEGAGDYFPPYAGNLDIMTAAAAATGDRIAKHMAASSALIERSQLMPYSSSLDVRMTDTCLRDGSHAKNHQFTEQQVRDIVASLDAAGMPVIEVTHGDGLGGSSFNYGFSLTDERLLMKAAVETATRAKIAALMVPGIGTMDDIRFIQDIGLSIVRVATHCTEADVSIQHFGLARSLGLETVGFLMMAHGQPPELIAKQARIMADAGCQCVYVVDSAGAMILEDVQHRVEAVVAELGNDAQTGFHGHDNLGIAVANSVIAVRAGAVQIDGSVRGFGAGAGNTTQRGVRRGGRSARHQHGHRRAGTDGCRRRGRASGDGQRVHHRPPRPGDGLRRRVLQLLEARLPRRRAVRRQRRRCVDAVRRAEARRWSGGPDHLHRRGPRSPQMAAADA